MSASDIHQTDRWLCRLPSGPARPLVTLNARPGTLPPHFTADLRDYLASLDDETDDWRAFTAAELMELATHPLQATGGRALAPADGCDGCTCPGDDCGARKKYRAAIELLRLIARRGGAVVTMTGACRATRDYSHAFHVWFECGREHRLHRWARWHGVSAAEAESSVNDQAQREEDWLHAAFGPRSEGCAIYCHLSLNLDQLGGCPLVEIVGDTVLEWSAARSRLLRRRSVKPSEATDPARVLPFPALKL
jgi:hypothetical protein